MPDVRELTVRVKPLGGQWETLGADRFPGVTPEHFTASSNAWGNDTCGFQLRRDAGALQPDLSAFTPCDVEIAGMRVWSGRVRETPSQDGDDAVINVQGEGWQYHLDDDVYDTAVYVHSSLTDWVDARDFTTADLVRLPTAPSVTPTRLAYPTGTVIPAKSWGAVMLDLGSARAKRISIDYYWFGGGATADWYLRAIGGATVSTGATADILLSSQTQAISVAKAAMGAGATVSGTFSTPAKIVMVGMYFDRIVDSAAQTSDTGVQITGIRIYTDTSYESGGQSVLTADTPARDARVQAAPLLSTDTSKITAGTFVLPDFAADGARSPREVITTANAYENYETSVDVNARLVFRPRASTPAYAIGEWSGASFADASGNSGEDIYNRVLVQGTGPDGSPLTVERTASPATTLPDRQGFRRTKILPLSAPMTTAVGQRIGDLFLAAHRTTPFRGAFQAVGVGGVRRFLGGTEVHPAWLLRDPGQLVHCAHRTDPDTGAWGRDGRIATVTYDHNNLTASVSLDEDRSGLNTLLTRYGALAGT